jgi:hypothetical protein
MKQIKSLMMLLLILTVAVAGSYAAYNRGKLNKQEVVKLFSSSTKDKLPPQLATVVEKVTGSSKSDSAAKDVDELEASENPGNLDSSESEQNKSSENNDSNNLTSQISFDPENATEQLQILSERGVEIGGHLDTVLGDFVQVNEDDEQALHESAFDYGRYLYCQQVVKEYEEKNDDT